MPKFELQFQLFKYRKTTWKTTTRKLAQIAMALLKFLLLSAIIKKTHGKKQYNANK
jgi:hypothetical protein